MDCLFIDVATCEGEKSEHLIQKCLGGTLERSDVICGACNTFFGKEVDPGIGVYFQHLIDMLRPLMPSEFREVERRVRSAEDNVSLVLRGGGVAEIGKIHQEADATGVLKAVSGPASTPRQTLEAITNALAPERKFKFRMVPLSQITDSGMTLHEVRFAHREHRAAAKSILEILDWQCKKLGLPAYARMPQVHEARDYIRNGRFGFLITAKGSPIFYLEEEMERIFSPRTTVFSNRVLVVNDATADRCFGLIQIANTMPLGVALGKAVDSTDFGLLYEAGLFAGDRDRMELRRELLIPWKKFYESRFIIKNKATNEFAFLKLHETVVRELGRALVYMDMNYVDNLQEVLRQHVQQRVELADVPDRSIIREVCEPLLKLRFKRNAIRTSEWNALMEPLSD